MDYSKDWEARNAEYLMDEPEEVISLFPTHPGQLLKDEVLPERGITGVALAKAIKASRPDVTAILNGKKPVRALMAARIQRATGYPATMLLRLQEAWDLAQIERDEQERLDAIPLLAATA